MTKIEKKLNYSNSHTFIGIEKNFNLVPYNYNQVKDWFSANDIIFDSNTKHKISNLIANANKKIAYN